VLASGAGDLETFNVMGHTASEGGASIVGANWTMQGAFAGVDAIPAFAPWMEAMVNQPLVGANKLGNFECSGFNWGLESGARIAPISGSFEVTDSTLLFRVSRHC